MEQIEDALSQNYRLNAHAPISCEVGGATVSGTLFYKKIGSPPHMAFVVEFVHPKTGQLQTESLGSAPMYWRCAAVQALPVILDAIKSEHQAAQERLQDAVQNATAFLQKIS